MTLNACDYPSVDRPLVSAGGVLVYDSRLHNTKCAVAVIGCSYTDPVISMDLLRTVLQPSFNEDIVAVFRKYMKVS